MTPGSLFTGKYCTSVTIYDSNFEILRFNALSAGRRQIYNLRHSFVEKIDYRDDLGREKIMISIFKFINRICQRLMFDFRESPIVAGEGHL